MDDAALVGKVAIVTGASSGIGRAIAERLGTLGAEVYLSGRTKAPMDELAALIDAAGGTAHVDVLDVRDLAALQDYITRAAEASGGLHIMVNNAGLGYPDSIVDGDVEQWREMFDTNVLALAAGCQAAVRAMRATGSEGHIINISSTATINRASGMYGATKYAVNCINSTLREELADDPIRPVVIKPGVFSSNFPRHYPREILDGLVSSLGVDAEFDDDGKTSLDVQREVQRRMSRQIGDVARIADVVEFVVTQPIDIHVEEILLRPPQSLDI